MRLFSSTEAKLFFCTWVIFTMYFATNVVREHYPAFSLINSGTFKVDEFAQFHPDIFEHEDGHWYIGNNVMGSVLVAVPLLIFDPILDMVENYEKQEIAEQGVIQSGYRTTHTNSQIFLSMVREQGLSLRFGATTVITTAFFMAPLSALLVLMMYRILRSRQTTREHAWWLAAVFAVSTPLFFRTGVLNHNVLEMHVLFYAFVLLWNREQEDEPVSVNRRLLAGMLCGLSLALDYSGVVPILVFFGYVIVKRLNTTTLTESIKESIPFVIGSVPPVLFLLYTQWAMFGNPFLPGQYWMPDAHSSAFNANFVNPYSTEGFRGFTFPKADLYFLNLFSSSYGMFIYGPLLILALIPVSFYRDKKFALPRAERLFIFAFFFAFLTFCSANQFSRIQFNSGFRYMIPLVPFMFLALSEHLVRLPRIWLWVLLIPVTINSWVISMVREAPPESWKVILSSGPQLPWLSVLRASSDPNHPILSSSMLPFAVTFFGFMVVAFILWLGRSR